MAAIILGGAPEANWLPLLIPLVAVFLIVVSAEYLVRYVKRRFGRKPALPDDAGGKAIPEQEDIS